MYCCITEHLFTEHLFVAGVSSTYQETSAVYIAYRLTAMTLYYLQFSLESNKKRQLSISSYVLFCLDLFLSCDHRHSDLKGKQKPLKPKSDPYDLVGSA